MDTPFVDTPCGPARVFGADDFEFLGLGIPDLMTELRPPKTLLRWLEI